MSCGAVSPGIFVKKCSRLLPTTPAKEKLGCMSELQTGRRALKVHQSAILDPGQRAMCITGQKSWVLDGRIIKGFMPSVATLRHSPAVPDMRSNLSQGVRVAEFFSCDRRECFSTPRLMLPTVLYLECSQCTLHAPPLTFIIASTDHIQFWRVLTGTSL